MARVWGLVLWEVRIQARYYIYLGVAVVVALLSGMIAIIPLELPASQVAFLLFTESGVLAFFFVGILVLMEKTEGTLNALGVTPTPAWLFVLARSVSLTVLSLIGGYVMVAVDFGDRADIGVVLLALALTSAMAVLWGFVVVAGVPSVNAYLARAILLMVVLMLPILGLLGFVDPWFMAILPSHASLLLLNGAVEPASLGRLEWVYAVSYLSLWIAMASFGRFGPSIVRSSATGTKPVTVFLTLMLADICSVVREGILVFIVAAMLITLIVVRLMGVYQLEWGTGPFLAFALIALLLFFAVGIGMVVGLILVEEAETGVRDVLSVTPVPTAALLLYRSVLAFAAALIAGVVGVVLTQVVALPPLEWAALLFVTALLAPTVALAVPAIARNKIEALVLFRVLGVVVVGPIVTFMLGDEWYRYVFLVSPAGFIIEAYRAFLAGIVPAYLWLAGGVVYAVVLLALATVRFQRVVYRLNR